MLSSRPLALLFVVWVVVGVAVVQCGGGGGEAATANRSLHPRSLSFHRAPTSPQSGRRGGGGTLGGGCLAILWRPRNRHKQRIPPEENVKDLLKTKPRSPADHVRLTRELLRYIDRDGDLRDAKREEKVGLVNALSLFLCLSIFRFGSFFFFFLSLCLCQGLVLLGILRKGKIGF